MKNKLLSIVVPTKNRAEYLKALIDIVVGFENDDIELVIEDNSEDNAVILEYLRIYENKNIIYNHEKQQLSVVENSDRAIKHSSGKYVIFIGDDDLVSKYLYDFVCFMNRKGLDSAIFQTAKYYWPGVEFKTHRFPNLVINNYKSKIKVINARDELKKVLKTGATALEYLPKVYHGIVLRERLDEVFAIAGTYFPGPSPDMANAIALALVVKQHIYCDIPLVVAGASPKSAAGLGTKHKHEGDLNNKSFLPKDTEQNWTDGILKVWTGPTIYAQSAIYALQKIKREDLRSCFNYNYHYAFLSIFCPTYRLALQEFNKNNHKFNCILYQFYYVKIFLHRVKKYIENKLLLKFSVGGLLINNVSSTIEAEKYLDEEIEKNNIRKILEVR